jgi:hypothetical protein
MKRSVEDSRVPAVAGAVRHFRSSYGAAGQWINPDEAAVCFYMLNHAFAKIAAKRDQHMPLTAAECAICEDYVIQANLIARYMINYLLLIITRESRHAYHNTTRHDVCMKYGNTFEAFNCNIRGLGSENTAEYFLQTPPDMCLGPYVAGVTDLFFNANFSGSFGGHKWGSVAETLRKYVFGEISAEILLDTVFTLVHNGGPIFNKGMFVVAQNNLVLRKILDVQRSGQVPELVNDSKNANVPAYSYWMSPRVLTAFNCAQAAGVEGFNGYVDWFAVEALGAVGHYAAEKTKQVAKHGISSFAAKHEQAQAAKLLQEALLENKKFFVNGTDYAYVTERPVA